MLAGVMTYAVGIRGPFSETIYFEIAFGREGGSGWLYPYDSARALMMLPYKLATVMSSSSYWPFQLVQFLLLALIGILVMLFVKIAWDLPPRFAAVAGSVAVVFGGDLSVAFSGMVIVRQSIAFWLVALVFLALAATKRWWLALFAVPFELAAAFTYDPILLALVVSPLLVHALRRLPWRAVVTWFAPLAGVVGFQAWRYVIQSASSYQMQQLVAESLWTTIGRLGRLVATALVPIAWPAQWSGTLSTTDTAAWLAVIGWGLVSATLAIACVALLPGRAPSGRRRLRRAWGATGILLLACIGPYLFINAPFAPPGTGYPDGPWRSLLFAAVPIALAAGLLMDSLGGRQAAQGAIAAVLLACGVTAGIAAQLGDKARWRQYTSIFGAIKGLAPDLRPGTLVVLDGLSGVSQCPRCIFTPGSNADPFTSSIWFNSGLQLAYPSGSVVGSYRDQSGVWAPDTTVVVNPSGATIPYANVGVSNTRFRDDQIVVIGWNNGQPQIKTGRHRGWPFKLSSAGVLKTCPKGTDTPLLGSLPHRASTCATQDNP